MCAAPDGGSRCSARRDPAPRRARHREQPDGSLRSRLGRSGAAALAVVGAVLVLGVIGAVFSSTTSGPPSVYSAGQLTPYDPAAVTATRVTSTTCLVSWTPASSLPAGVTYDVTDGTSTVATGVSGTSRTITVPVTAVTPTVKVRLNNWVSAAGTAASTPCNGFPSAPSGVVATASDATVAVSWTAPSANGGTLTSYSVSGAASDGSGTATCTATAPATSCSLTGVTNGVTYTVTVTATSEVGTGPASTAVTAIPYPSSIMGGANLRLWLDGADISTLFTGSGCSGAVTTTGQGVGCWRDKSGAGSHLTQATSTQRPTTSTVAGRPVPTFDGSNDWLSRSSTTLPTGTASSTTFVAAETSGTPATAGEQELIWQGTSTAAGSARDLYKPGSSAQLATTAYATTDAGAGTLVTNGGFVAVSDFTSGTSYGIRFNGTSRVSRSVAHSTVGTYVELSYSAVPWQGPVKEVVVVAAALTDAEIRTVEQYLARKWSTTIAPSAPASVVAPAGDGQSSVSWTAPSWNGGAAVTGYTVTAVPSDGTLSTVTQACASSPCTVSGLTNGVTYTVTVTATNSAGTGPASTAVSVVPRPALLAGTNAVLWLDGVDVDGDGVLEGTAESCDTSTSCTSTSNVLKRWVDKTGNGRDAVQSTTAMAGTYTPATGLVSFSANGYYRTAAGVPTGPGVTTFAVASAAASTFNTWGWFVGGRAANGWILHPGQGSAFANFFGMTSAGYNDQTAGASYVSPATALTNPHVWDGQISGGTSSQTLDMAVDGVVSAAASSTATRAAANVVLTIGGDDYDLVARRGNGTFREVLVFKTALTATERRTVREYLARKWGAPIVPDAPTGASATPSTTANQTATVSWTAPAYTGGSAITSYTVTGTPADATAATVTSSCASSPCSVSGFTDGTSYTVTVAAVNAAGTGASTTATTSNGTTLVTYPAAVMTTSATRLWMDGADPATILTSTGCTGATAAAGTTIGCWKDKSAQANDAVQTTATKQPTVSSLNGLSAPMFDGTDDYYPLAVAKLPTGTTPSSVWSVAVQEDTTPASSSWRHAIGWGAAGTGLGRVLEKGSGNSNLFLETYDSWATVTPTKTWPIGTAVVTDGVITSSTLSSNVNGAVNYTGTATNNTGTSAGAALGATGWSTGETWKGRIAEMVVTNTAATSAQTRVVQEYLARKWGVSITPAVPGTPSATGGLNTATVTWAAPSWNGGASITSYTVAASPGGATCTSATTSCTFSGMAPGTYTFTVTATNSVGTSTASSASSSTTVYATLYAWGDGSNARTGVILQSSSTSSPARAPGPETWATLSMGDDYGCGITSAGALSCWGSNDWGSLGVGDSTNRWEPVQVSGGGTWTAVDAGENTTCGIKSNQTLWCWGYGGGGEMGNGTTTATNNAPVAVTATGVTTWSQVSVGQNHVCARKTDSTLWCWGVGGSGRLGNGSTSNQSTPQQVSAGTTWSWVSAGHDSSCAIRSSDSALYCFGNGLNGAMGNGTTTDSTTPTAVSGGLAAVRVSVGEHYACAVTTGGAVYCWGWNGNGQLGDGSTTDRTSPVRESTSASTWATAPLSPAASGSPVLMTWSNHTCAVRSTGTLWCWGYNGVGQLGDSTTTQRTSPTQVGSATSWASVSGTTDGTCGLRTDAALWCFGNDGAGQLAQYYGNSAGSPTPLLAPGSYFTTGSTGYMDGCGVRSDGTLWCWGNNGNGVVGDGTITARWSPVQVGSATTWRSVSIGSTAVCATRTDDSLWCWGYAGYGQTGISGASGNVTTPTAGPAGSWSSVSVGDTHTCGIKTDGTLWCWGENLNGGIGDGTTTNRATPVAVTATGVTTWASVSAGFYNTCAVADTGTYAGGLFCWGYNINGQLGDGTTTNRNSPTRIGTATWSDVVAGRGHTCGVRTAGTLWCWGYNGNGQLGDGTTTQKTSPTQVGALTTWAEAVAGYEHSCARRTDSTLWCWGLNNARQLGNRGTTNITTPNQVPGVTVSRLGDTHNAARTTVALS